MQTSSRDEKSWIGRSRESPVRSRQASRDWGKERLDAAHQLLKGNLASTVVLHVAASTRIWRLALGAWSSDAMRLRSCALSGQPAKGGIRAGLQQAVSRQPRANRFEHRQRLLLVAGALLERGETKITHDVLPVVE